MFDHVRRRVFEHVHPFPIHVTIIARYWFVRILLYVGLNILKHERDIALLVPSYSAQILVSLEETLPYWFKAPLALKKMG